jgi:hypothetical protein
MRVQGPDLSISLMQDYQELQKVYIVLQIWSCMFFFFWVLYVFPWDSASGFGGGVDWVLTVER